MQTPTAFRLSSWLLLILWSLAGCDQPATTDTALIAGASSATINPPPGAFIAGDKPNRHFTGIRDSLYARAVVVYDGQTAVALVTLDCIGLLYPEVQQIQRRASARVTRFALPAAQVVVSSTHTHSGPDVVGIWGADYTQSGVDSVYMERLIETAVDQITRAAAAAVPVQARSASATAGEGWVQNICQEELDRSLTLIHLRSPEGQSIATLTNFACHPTYMDARYSEVSADYVGAYCHEMKRQLGGEHLFLQGAIGGWVQPVEPDGETTPEKAETRGHELATQALQSLAHATSMPATPIRFRSMPLTLPLENPAWQQLAAAGVIRRAFTDSVTTEVAWFALGSAQFATHPGETAPYFGLETKKMMQTDGPKFILGLSQDALGYILKPVYFEDPAAPHAAYLTSMSTGPQTGPRILACLRALIPPAHPDGQ